MPKLLKWLVFLLLALLGTTIYQWPDDQVHLIACDVGQGDGLIVYQGFTQVIIDGGEPNGLMSRCLSRHLPFWDRHLEVVIISHPQLDHFGGLIRVLDSYKVDTLLTSNIVNPTTEYYDLVTSVQKSVDHIEVAKTGQHIILGDMDWRILWPRDIYHNSKVYEQPLTTLSDLDLSSQPTDPNDASVVALLTVGENKALFTGDISEEIEQQMLPKLPSSIDILKVAHHGSKTSSSESFIDRVHPSIALISVGADNTHGHPHARIIDRLRDVGATILRTDELGDIHLVLHKDRIVLK